jgi:hypothetical protein
MATYYAATEGIGGASFGKRIFGWCVTDVDGTTPGLLRDSLAAIAAPERGMHERLTATWLVPR